MPAVIQLKNAEVMSADTRTSTKGKTMLSLLVRTWNAAGQDKKPEPVTLRLTVFNVESLKLKTGDKIDVTKGTFKMNSNPNYVQVRRDTLPTPSDSDLKPSSFAEVTCFEDGIELLEEGDPTTRKGKSGGGRGAWSGTKKTSTETATSSTKPKVAAEDIATFDPWGE